MKIQRVNFKLSWQKISTQVQLTVQIDEFKNRRGFITDEAYKPYGMLVYYIYVHMYFKLRHNIICFGVAYIFG